VTAAPRLLGAVLAGGGGSRFGGPKAEVRIGGVRMAERAVVLLRTVVEDVVVVSARPLSAPPAPVIPDRVEGVGPLGGLDAALHHARDRGYEGVLLVACDLPLLTPALLDEVASALGSHPAVAPARHGAGVEPLCAVYRVEVLEAVERRLAQEDRSLHALFRDVGGHVLPAAAQGAGDPFLNVNTLDELERAEAALAAGGDR
jgi:molybdenum cofactor guanylyltransferase